jgi:MtN3 and saliva related transmembrane protein
MALAPVLQMVRMVRRRSADDISVHYFRLLVPGFILWADYGLITGDLFVAIPNLIATVTAVSVIALTVSIRRNAQRSDTGHREPVVR